MSPLWSWLLVVGWLAVSVAASGVLGRMIGRADRYEDCDRHEACRQITVRTR